MKKAVRTVNTRLRSRLAVRRLPDTLLPSLVLPVDLLQLQPLRVTRALFSADDLRLGHLAADSGIRERSNEGWNSSVKGEC